MKAPRFQQWYAELLSLNPPQRRQVLDAVRPAAGRDHIKALVEQLRSPSRRCPRCASECWHRHGHANGRQRYRCRACGRTFNDLSGTPLARLRLREKWLAYLDTLLDARPVRTAASRIGVHRNTAFRWRHRFLDGVKHDQPPPLSGILSAELPGLAPRPRWRTSHFSRTIAKAGFLTHPQLRVTAPFFAFAQRAPFPAHTPARRQKRAV